MVIKRSKLPKKNLEKICRRGQIVTVRENEFQISFNSKEFVVVKKEDSKFYGKPYMKAGVLCIYFNKKKEFIDEIYSLDGKIIFQKRI